MTVMIDGIIRTGPLKNPKTVAFSLSATGVDVSAVTGRRIKVIAYKVVVSAAISWNWRRGSTDIEGSQPYLASGGATEVITPPMFLFATDAGEALSLVITGVGTASGRVTYFDDDDV